MCVSFGGGSYHKATFPCHLQPRNFISKEGKGFPSFGPATPHNFPAQIVSNVSWVMKNCICHQPAMPVRNLRVSLSN